MFAAETPVLVHNCDLGVASTDQSVENNAAALKVHGSDGFTGVYDPVSDSFHARVSSGKNPLVSRAGGHGDINAEVYEDSGGTVGFVALKGGDGSLQMRWNSISVNERSFGDRAAPRAYRNSIRMLSGEILDSR